MLGARRMAPDCLAKALLCCSSMGASRTSTTPSW